MVLSGSQQNEGFCGFCKKVSFPPGALWFSRPTGRGMSPGWEQQVLCLECIVRAAQRVHQVILTLTPPRWRQSLISRRVCVP